MNDYLNSVVRDLKIVDVDEKNNSAVVITYNKSFVARTTETSEQIKEYFAELLTNLLGHEGVRDRISWNYISFSYKRKQLAKINIRGNVISLYLALNPQNYLDAKYKIEDVSDKKTYASVPLLYKIRGARTFKYAFALLNDLYEQNQLIDAPYFLDEKKFTHDYLARPVDILLKEGLVKEIRRKSKLDRAIKRQERLLDKDEQQIKVKIYAQLVNPYLVAEKLYIVGNIPELGEWDPKKGLELEKIKPDYFEINLKLLPCHLEFKILRGRDYLDVEKGMWTEEIRDHSYDIVDEIVIEDLIYNFREDKGW